MLDAARGADDASVERARAREAAQPRQRASPGEHEPRLRRRPLTRSAYAQLLVMAHGPVTRRSGRRARTARCREACSQHLLRADQRRADTTPSWKAGAWSTTCAPRPARRGGDVVLRSWTSADAGQGGASWCVRSRSPAWSEADREKLGQVLVNLLPTPSVHRLARPAHRRARAGDGEHRRARRRPRPADWHSYAWPTPAWASRARAGARLRAVRAGARARARRTRAAEGHGARGSRSAATCARGMGGDLRVRSTPGEGLDLHRRAAPRGGRPAGRGADAKRRDGVARRPARACRGSRARAE
jgi:hypothetical protein